MINIPKFGTPGGPPIKTSASLNGTNTSLENISWNTKANTKRFQSAIGTKY